MLLSTVLQEGTSASVGTRQVAGQEAQEGECRVYPGVQGGWAGKPVMVVTGLSRVSGVKEKIFMQESDALNFLKKRSKRSPRSRDEVNGKEAGGLASCSFFPQSAGLWGPQGPRAQLGPSGSKVTSALTTCSRLQV